MYSIISPLEGCLVFATKEHPKLMCGARIGVCTKVLKGLITVSDLTKDYLILTNHKLKPLHSYWLEGEKPVSKKAIKLLDLIDKDYDGKTHAFANTHSIINQSVAQWCQGGWIVHNDTVCSPQARYNQWVEKQPTGEYPMSLKELIAIHYSGSCKLFAKKNGLVVNLVQAWLREKWFISEGVMYKPRRKI